MLLAAPIERGYPTFIILDHEISGRGYDVGMVRPIGSDADAIHQEWIIDLSFEGSDNAVRFLFFKEHPPGSLALTGMRDAIACSSADRTELISLRLSGAF